MTDGFVQFVWIFSRMPLKHHAATIYFVLIALDKLDSVLCVTNV